MARRSSARLRGQNAATPKRVSLSHDDDAPIMRTPRTLPTKLESLQESDEMPGSFPASASSDTAFAPQPVLPKNLSHSQSATPIKGTPIKPAPEEMHPQLHHQTTAKPRDEARHLGFSKIIPQTEPLKHRSRVATLQATPTKARNLEDNADSPDFRFTFRREHSLELSPAAKILMNESREEAARIRVQMIANGEGKQSTDEIAEARRIAKPKSRFSQAHTKEFDKMESIAARPSALRVKPATTSASSQNDSISKKSLKRSPSKAGLDQSSSAPSSRPSSQDVEKYVPAIFSTQVPRSTSTEDFEKHESRKSCSPAKRVKLTETDDVSTTRPPTRDVEKPLPSTTQGTHTTQDSKFSNLMTPTRASLARAANLKSNRESKIPGPSFTPTQATPARGQVKQARNDGASPLLLARSPSKPSVFSMPTLTKPNVENTTDPASPLLARSPLKEALPKKRAETEDKAAVSGTQVPALLCRSPMKAAMPKISELQTTKKPASLTPFLARSPSKLPLVSEATETSGKDASSKLLGRFNLLRKTPMKSILRTPQRLYSDDPAKVAAGTHFAAPPKFAADTIKALPARPPATAPVQKHVDFTSSTKAREANIQSSTPSKTPTPSPKAGDAVALWNEPEIIGYPDLSKDIATLSPSPQKRRQTSGPGDFTFRAGDQSIIFSQPRTDSTNFVTGAKPSTIRVVSAGQGPPAAPIAGSKKRKFQFENTASQAATEDVASLSDKENTARPLVEEEQESRPAKRVKKSGLRQASAKPDATAPAPASVAKRNTLGIKAKKTTSPVKRAGTISAARLNALAQPKRR